MPQDPPAEEPTSFGVFKPIGHVVVSFADAQDADAAAQALRQAGFADGSGKVEAALRRMSDREMLAQAEGDIERASPVAAIGQELNLVKAHRELARRGYHWLVVDVDGDDEQAQRVAEIVRGHKAERAQHYGRFIVEELIEHEADEAQVAESPDRGLDAQTPSGHEGERKALRPEGAQGEVNDGKEP